MSDRSGAGISRRALLQGAGIAAGALLGVLPRRAWAHDLKPGDPMYRFADYEGIVNRDLRVRQVYEWPNINNPIVFGNVRNGVNGFQFSYDIPPSQIQVVVQAYASANAAMYDDYIWEKYSWGERLGVKDPATNEPAKRNIWFKSAVPAVSQPPAERNHPFYNDTSIEGLQRRGVLFLT
jgi:hypothetical protein